MGFSPSYVKTKIIEITDVVADADNLLTSQGLSKTLHFFGVSGNLLNDSTGQESRVEFSDGSGSAFLTFDSSNGGSNHELNSGFFYMNDDDSYIRINEGLNVKYVTGDSSDRADIAITVIYQ